VKLRKIVKEYKNATTYEIWEGIRDNFTFGFLGATLVVFIATRTDFAVLVGYVVYYYYMGRIVNRPKYAFIVFVKRFFSFTNTSFSETYFN